MVDEEELDGPRDVRAVAEQAHEQRGVGDRDLMTADMGAWVTPTYITEGLRWLSSQLGAEVIEIASNPKVGTDV